jgi:N-acetylneuraminate synthase
MVNFNNLQEPYFIGEIGINHNGDIRVAKKLIDAINACSWSCAKFQKRNPDVCVPDHQKNKIRETPWGTMTYIDYKHKIEFDKKEFDIINQYCSEKPVDWTASVWDIGSLNFLLQYDVPFLKIPSALITDIELVAECAKSNKPVIMSTGMSTIDEVDNAVETILKYGDKPVIMHTNSSYPTPRKELNLNLITTLKQRYDCTIGYSGHEEDLEPTVLAVALGAKVIERHITLSHNMWGTDQKASLEVHAMSMLKKRCEDIDIMLGSYDKKVTESELPIREKLRKF